MDKKITDAEFVKMQEEYMEKFGNYPVPEFDKLSANQMNSLIENFLEEESPIKIYSDIPENILKEIPILQMVKLFLEITTREKGTIKLTQAGYLPPKIVKEIYDSKLILDPYIESGEIKLNKELDCMIVELVKILCILGELVVEDGGKLKITELGENLLKNEVELLNVIFNKYNKELNWSYFDGCGDNMGFQSNIGFVLYLIKKYGRKKLNLDLYIEKFDRALPSVYEEFIPFKEDSTDEEKTLDYRYTFYLRVIERLCGYFNLVNVYVKNDNIILIEKNDIYDRVIEFSKS